MWVDALRSWPVWLIHGLALSSLWLAPPTLTRVATLCVAYALLMIGVTAGYHRYFSHRSFRTSRPMQFVLAWWAMCALQKGVIWWASTHRLHHRHSDTPRDPHSPVQHGLWWAHMGWTLSDRSNVRHDDVVSDWLDVPELTWLDRWWMLPPIATLSVVGLISGWQGILWAYLLPVVLCWHGTYTINSLSHVWGSRRFETPDDSRNNAVTALITMGEGWHNNHHRHPGSARQGLRWWELDVTFYVLWLLAQLRLIWSVNAPRKNSD